MPARRPLAAPLWGVAVAVLLLCVPAGPPSGPAGTPPPCGPGERAGSGFGRGGSRRGPRRFLGAGGPPERLVAAQPLPWPRDRSGLPDGGGSRLGPPRRVRRVVRGQRLPRPHRHHVDVRDRGVDESDERQRLAPRHVRSIDGFRLQPRCRRPVRGVRPLRMPVLLDVALRGGYVGECDQPIDRPPSGSLRCVPRVRQRLLRPGEHPVRGVSDGPLLEPGE